MVDCGIDMAGRTEAYKGTPRPDNTSSGSANNPTTHRETANKSTTHREAANNTTTIRGMHTPQFQQWLDEQSDSSGTDYESYKVSNRADSAPFLRKATKQPTTQETRQSSVDSLFVSSHPRELLDPSLSS